MFRRRGRGGDDVGERAEGSAFKRQDGAHPAGPGQRAADRLDEVQPRLQGELQRGGVAGDPLDPLRRCRAGLKHPAVRVHHAEAPAVGRQQATGFQLVADKALRHFAVAGLWQSVPEEHPLRHLVAGDPGRHPGQQLRLIDGGAGARDADRDADLAPDGIGHAEHRDLGDGRVGQDLLLDLARVDVGAAGDVFVGGPAGNIQVAFGIHVADIAGQEPAIAERLGVGFRVVVVAGEYGRPDDADLAGLARRQLAAFGVLDRDLHAGALDTRRCRSGLRDRPRYGGCGSAGR